MDPKIFRFYEAFKSHEFTEEQMNDVVEGMKTIIRDESRDNATKADIEKVLEKINGLEVGMSKRFEYVHEKISDYHRNTLTWLVTKGIAITGLIVALIKLL